ncbi:IS1-like element transposase [Xenorhabdus koppenhoeferi]
MEINNSGIRDTARVLKESMRTIMRTLRERAIIFS